MSAGSGASDGVAARASDGVAARASDGVRLGTPTILAEILESTRREVEQRKRAVPVEELIARAAAGGTSTRLRDALSRPGMRVIAEIKRRSPSAGALREGLDVAEVAAAYERSGASALSVLTEGPHFGGSLDDLRAAREACELPILRKDFIVDPYQLHEAVAAGADAVLLIVAALTEAELSDLRERAMMLGLDTLVEVHDSDELEIAISAGASLIGVNNRDLRDFSVDVSRTFALIGKMPKDAIVVSESGISSAGQIQELAQAGVDAVLIGESLMRSGDPGIALEALIGTERS